MRHFTLTRVWAAFGLLLILATWKLWTPQTEFPVVPLLAAAHYVSTSCDWFCLVALLGCLVAALGVTTRYQQPAKLGVVLLLAILFCMNQHRLQPWAYQLAVFGILLSIPSPGRQIYLGRVVMISIYVFSAASKFDYLFVHTLGQQFLDTLLNALGLPRDLAPERLRPWLAGAFPSAELLVGLGLIWKRTRFVAAVGAILLHMLLLVVLGPWGLAHQPAVLLWNVQFIVLIGLLFIGVESQPYLETEMDKHSFRGSVREANFKTAVVTGKRREAQCESLLKRWFATGSTVLVGVAVLAPLGEPLGWFDHWPSWQLYAPRNSRAIVSVMANRVDQLPPHIQRLLPVNTGDDPWLRLDIDRWSIEAVGAPIYPQDRFQVGVGLAIAERFELEGGIRVQWQTVADRWTGERDTSNLLGTRKIRESSGAFRLNATPRPAGSTP